MNQIMMSLQVQDITEQQLSSVNHLIETVRDRIDALLDRLGTGEADRGEAPSADPGRTATFNMNAEYDRSDDRQRMADDLMAGKDVDGPTGGQNGASAPQSSSNNGASSGGGEAASQSDIDEMFEEGADSEGASDGGEAASQEEIDELFQ
jgi:hypothetical protein